jgi:HK97 family phage prohead protease
MSPVKTKAFFAKIKTVNEDDWSFNAIASTNELDRDEEIILPSAFLKRLDSFNGVLLSGHQHRLSTGSSPVIGSVSKDKIQITENVFDFEGRFAKTPLGTEYKTLYKDGHMTDFSIGFIPISGHQETKDGKKYYVHTEVELLEISAVPVGSNRGAKIRSKNFDVESSAIADPEDLKSYIDDKLNSFSKEISSLRESIESSLEDIKSLLVPGSDEFADVLLSGEDPVESIPCKDKDKAGQSLLRIKNAFKIYGE